VGVRRIEAGDRRVTVDDLTALSKALDVPAASLLEAADATPRFVTRDEVQRMIREALESA